MRYRPGASRPRPLAVHVSLGAFALVALLAPFASPAQIVREKVNVERHRLLVTARTLPGARSAISLLKTSPCPWTVKPVRIDSLTPRSGGEPAGAVAGSPGADRRPPEKTAEPAVDARARSRSSSPS